MSITYKVKSIIKDNNTSGICYGNKIRNLKLKEAIKHFALDLNTNILALIDCTVLGPFKYGLIITEAGLIWINQSRKNIKEYLDWITLINIKNNIKIEGKKILFGDYGHLDMTESRHCNINDAFKLFHNISNEIINTTNNSEIANQLSNSNKNVYINIVPKLIAIFIIADGIIQENQIELADNLIMNDELIEDKEKAFMQIKETMNEMLSYINKSYAVFTLKINSLVNQLFIIDCSIIKERLLIIVKGMAKNTSGHDEEETLNILESIKNKLL